MMSLIALVATVSGCDESDGGGTTEDSKDNAYIVGLHRGCTDGTCPTGLTPVEYYGIAGTNGPQFCSCEIPCAETEPRCPTSMSCIYVADGPGTVCAQMDDAGKPVYP